ncbi:MAG: ATP-binding cassette domain-containing protein, partial [Bdellovibrionales bacterium]|nr:ATP-binding cassette domain-containing protein [Bdellovibrionales bacterium]
SGSGKSSLLRLAAGQLTPQSGTVTLEGNALAANQHEVILLHQELNLWPHLTIEESLSLIQKGNPASLGAEEKNLLSECLGISNLLHRYPRQLSGGQRQRAALLRVLLARPKYILLDEPTSALDTETTETVINMLSQVKQQGVGFLISSHDPRLLTAFCDRHFILEHGNLRGEMKLESSAIEDMGIASRPKTAHTQR